MPASPPPPAANALGAIGNTPVVLLSQITPAEGHAKIYLKLESLNPTGSYKDRLASSLLASAEARGALRPGMTVLECTGGSTGSSLAYVCAATKAEKQYTFHAVSSDAFAAEKLKTMRAFGAHLEIMPSRDGAIDAVLWGAMQDRTRELARSPDVFFADQFNNPDCLAGYASLGLELLAQFPDGIDGFCAAVGGASMAMGVSKVLRTSPSSASKAVKVVVLEPASSPALTKGHGGTHGVEGIGSGARPPHLDDKLFDEAWAVEEAEARAMCRRLATEEGLLVGTSTGLNVVAAVKLAKELGEGKTVVTVACDTGLKYLNSELLAEA
ncbi:tryptophan synthase beta subunit-like PLP-dependent enzyme [Polychaeton citri CBS 116435]|uniref:Tryptophan synthase beta subunit-like PLP-dependent enzyme n=1 Tax=Polychaeton citri CBS 116435 TaxID=1314669 RepID=A0A9P4USN9_9PEZI|nr:tryptophan synthase beta subunit-like PLP-dependent enzyme [Polychaeton citri CBS 116435]